MNKDIFDKEITDVTLRGEDIRGVFYTQHGTGTGIRICTRDKEYLVPDEGREIYNTLQKTPVESKYPSIVLFGKIRYRDLEVTKFAILEECDEKKGSESALDIDRELRRLMSEIISRGPGHSVSDLIAEFERVCKQTKSIAEATNESVRNKWYIKHPDWLKEVTLGLRCNCGRNANPHVAVGENNDPFNVKPW